MGRLMANSIASGIITGVAGATRRFDSQSLPDHFERNGDVSPVEHWLMSVERLAPARSIQGCSLHFRSKPRVSNPST